MFGIKLNYTTDLIMMSSVLPVHAGMAPLITIYKDQECHESSNSTSTIQAGLIEVKN